MAGCAPYGTTGVAQVPTLWQPAQGVTRQPVEVAISRITRKFVRHSAEPGIMWVGQHLRAGQQHERDGGLQQAEGQQRAAVGQLHGSCLAAALAAGTPAAGGGVR